MFLLLDPPPNRKHFVVTSCVHKRLSVHLQVEVVVVVGAVRGWRVRLGEGGRNHADGSQDLLSS